MARVLEIRRGDGTYVTSLEPAVLLEGLGSAVELPLRTLLEGISAKTVRARIWRGLVDDDAAARRLAEHEAIYAALVVGDQPLAEAAALVHVSTTERWLRTHLG